MPYADPSILTEKKPRKPYADPSFLTEKKPKKPYADPYLLTEEKPRKPYADPSFLTEEKPKKPYADPSFLTEKKPKKPYTDPSFLTEKKPKKPYADPSSFLTEKKPKKPYADPSFLTEKKPKMPYADPSLLTEEKPKKPYADPSFLTEKKPKKPYADPSFLTEKKPKMPYADPSLLTEEKPKKPYADPSLLTEEKPKKPYADPSFLTEKKPKMPYADPSFLTEKKPEKPKMPYADPSFLTEKKPKKPDADPSSFLTEKKPYADPSSGSLGKKKPHADHSRSLPQKLPRASTYADHSLDTDHSLDLLAGEEKEDYYEVFLSFCGGDTRTGLADHLYRSLVNAGVCVYKDENELRPGEVFGPTLLSAIRQSGILIPIISENYGSRERCLRELAHMMECKRNNAGYVVLPLFYGVKPYHVRHQVGRFGERFQSCTSRFDERTVEDWRQALGEVGSVLGFESTKGQETELIKKILENVNGELEEAHHLTLSLDEEVTTKSSLLQALTWLKRPPCGLAEMVKFSQENSNSLQRTPRSRSLRRDGKMVRNQIRITLHWYEQILRINPQWLIIDTVTSL